MRAYKTEIKLNKEQEALYKLCIAAQRFVWNLYIEENEKSDKYMNHFKFHKWLTNEYLKKHQEMLWIKKAGSRTLFCTIKYCHQAYERAFNKLGKFPRKKSIKNFTEGYSFSRKSPSQPLRVERHRMKVPMFGWVVIKEKGYIPFENILNGTIKKRASRYFLSVVTDEDIPESMNNINKGIGVDFGLKEFLTCSNNLVFKNENKILAICKAEKKLKRIQRALNRKRVAHKDNKELGWSNYNKNRLKLEKQYYKLECLRNDYINKCLEVIIECKPNFITVEDLNIEGMRKNKYLSKALSDSKFYYTKQTLIQKARKHGIEVREVSRFYPSSKKCSKCGNIKKDLKLKDRVYRCSCGLEIDRDLNASINLREAKEYKILTTGGLPGSNDCGVLYQTVIDNQQLTDYEAGHNEAVKSQLALKGIFDKKRNICYNYYSNVL